MKQMIITLLSVFGLTASLFAAETALTDTTIEYNGKLIRIQDGSDHINVQVSEARNNDTILYQPVFEGTYSDEKSYEKWTVVEDLGIQIPGITTKNVKKRQRSKMEPHLAGFGLGFSNITDGMGTLSNVNGMQVNFGRSFEYQYNMVEHIIPVFFRLIGITTGLGFNWRYLYMDNETYLRNQNQVTTVLQGDPSFHYKYSRVATWNLTVPLLVELQPFPNMKEKPYLAAGIEAGVKLCATYKEKYTNATGQTIRYKERGMNIPPLNLNYVAQIGYDDVTIYAKYSPYGLFQSGRGPEVHYVSMGFMLDF